MENFQEKLTALSDVYEHAKDQLIRLTISAGEHELQNNLFEDIKKLRNQAAEALQLSEKYVGFQELKYHETLDFILSANKKFPSGNDVLGFIVNNGYLLLKKESEVGNEKV